MEVFAAVLLVIVAFLLGWFTGNVVESTLKYRERRLDEARLADLSKQMYLEQRSDRE